MYVWSSHIAQEKSQPGKVVNSARGQLNREDSYLWVLSRWDIILPATQVGLRGEI